MKRMYLAVLFWSVLSTVMAQSEYRQAADQAFANLDKNGITTGILYDRVFPAANLRESGASSSAGRYQQAQAELYEASYNTQNRLTPDDLSSLIWQNQQRGVTLTTYSTTHPKFTPISPQTGLFFVMQPRSFVSPSSAS